MSSSSMPTSGVSSALIPKKQHRTRAPPSSRVTRSKRGRADQPNSTSSVSPSLDALPPEILHRIVRLLPPRTVYSVLPLLSRRIRSAARSAVAGCPDGEIGLRCTLLAKADMTLSPENTKEDNYPVEYRHVDDPTLESVRFLDSFETRQSLDRARTGSVWVGCSMHVRVTPWDVQECDGDVQAAIWESIRGYNTCSDFTLGGRRLHLCVAAISMWDLLGEGLDESDFAETMHQLRHFANSQPGLTRLRLLSEESAVTMQELQLFTPDETWNTVTEVEITSINGAMPDDISSDGEGIVVILKAFPNVRVLRGLYFTEEAAVQNVVNHATLEERSRIQTFHVSMQQCILARADCDTFLQPVLSALSVFPNLSELGTIILNSNDPPFAPEEGQPGHVTFLLPNLNTLHVQIVASSESTEYYDTKDLDPLFQWIESLQNLTYVHVGVQLELHPRGNTSDAQCAKVAERIGIKMVKRLFESLERQNFGHVLLHDVVYSRWDHHLGGKFLKWTVSKASSVSARLSAITSHHLGHLLRKSTIFFDHQLTFYTTISSRGSLVLATSQENILL